MNTSKLYARILYGAFWVTILWFIIAARDSLVFYILGAVLAYIFYPLVLWIDTLLQKAHLSPLAARILAILLLFLLLILSIAFFFTTMGDMLISQFIRIFQQIPISEETIEQILARANVALPDDLSLTQVIRDAQQELGINLQNTAQVAQTIFLGFFSAISQTVSLFLSLLLLPFWMFYLLFAPQAMQTGFLRLFPEYLRPDIAALGKLSDRVFKNYIRGQILLSLIIGIATTLGMMAIGMPNALALGVVAALCELIPIFGPYIAWLFALLVSMTVGWQMMLLVTIVFFIIQQTEGIFLIPKIQGDSVHFPPWLVMLTITIGGALWGILGMLIILPIAGVFVSLIHYAHLRLTTPNLTVPKALESVEQEPLSF